MVEEIGAEAGAPEGAQKPKKGPVKGAAAKGAMPKAKKAAKGARPKAAPKSAKLPRSVTLLVALVLVFAAAAYIASIPPTPPGPDGLHGNGLPAKDGIEAKLLYSNECKACDPYHSFELVLEANDINYSVEKVEAGSDEGQALVARYGVRSVPALVISEESVGSELTVTSDGGEVMQLKPILERELVGDAYVVYESRNNPFVSAMYLEAQDAECRTGAKPVVELFSEPYCHTCITSSPELESALDAFGDGIDFRYRYYPVFAQEIIEHTNSGRVDVLADRLICAAELGMYAGLEHAFVDLYCDKHGDGVSNQEEVSFCQLINPKYGKPLGIDDTETVIDNSGIGRAELTACLQGIEFRRGAGIEKAPLYEITADAVLPIAVIDCRHVVHAVNLRSALCGLHPELEGCEQG